MQAGTVIYVYICVVVCLCGYIWTAVIFIHVYIYTYLIIIVYTHIDFGTVFISIPNFCLFSQILALTVYTCTYMCMYLRTCTGTPYKDTCPPYMLSIHT
jgi:hypothetical protein